MKHLVFFSGGAGSFATTLRVLEKEKKEDVHLLFTDTLIEDRELYRFMLDAFEKIYSIDLSEAKKLVEELAEVEQDFTKRKSQLLEIQDIVNRKCENIYWIRYEIDGDGVDPWSIFYNIKFIGNSRIAQCSHIIKQRLAREYVKQNFNKDELIVYLGIDWNEEHRTKAPIKNWSEYAVDVRFPMCEAPYLMKDDIIKLIEVKGIRIPTPYLQGAPHLNCGGFCVRGGIGHFARLYQINPERFEYHAMKERNLSEMISKDGEKYSILKKTREGQTFSFSLDDLKEQLQNKTETIDMFDIGGCGCFVTEDKEEEKERWGLRDLKIVRFA